MKRCENSTNLNLAVFGDNTYITQESLANLVIFKNKIQKLWHLRKVLPKNSNFVNVQSFYLGGIYVIERDIWDIQ